VLRTHSHDGSSASKAVLFEARVVWYAAEPVDLTAAVIQLVKVWPEEPKEADASTKKQPEGGQANGDKQTGNR
jgi:hypothetical protein